MADHLTPDQLSRYLKRMLSSSELDLIHGHLAGCNECCQQAMVPFGAAYSSLRQELETEARLQPTHLAYEELEAYVDQKMDAAGREIVDSHVEFCASCREELRDLQMFRESHEGSAFHQSDARELDLLAGQPVAKDHEHPAITPARERRKTFWSSVREGWRHPAYWAGAAVAVAVAIVFTILLPSERNAKSHPAVTAQSGPAILPAHTAGLSSKPRLEIPKELAGLVGKTETLLGSTTNGDAFDLVGPVGTFVEDVRPVFHWRQLPGARSYTVSVFDSALNEVATGAALLATDWKSSVPLKRGVVYLWQVTAIRDGQQVVAPAPPAPEAKFEVLKVSDANRLAQLKRDALGSHFELGRAYSEAGIIDEAEREFQLVPASDPSYAWAQEFMAQLRALRLSAVSKP